MSIKNRMVTKLEVVLLLALIVVACFAGYACARPEQARVPAPERQTITIVDSAGRYVEVPWPVKRIAALSSESAMALVALGAKDTLVGISKYVIGDPWAPNVTNIGGSTDPNIEAIIATNPEVLITYTSWPSPERVRELEEKLEPLGIKVVCLDLWYLKPIFAEVRLLGLLVNRMEKAEELVNYWKGILDEIEGRVKKIPTEKRVRVYWELYRDYLVCGPNPAWHEILMSAGGINVFADSPIEYPKVSPDAVIEKNPDVILRSEPETTFKALGATDPTYLRKLYESIKARPGWSAINAVKENKVYVICSHYLHDVFGLIAETAYVAKMLYPEHFADLNPEAIHKRWLDSLGVEFKGIWTYPPLGSKS